LFSGLLDAGGGLAGVIADDPPPPMTFG